ncbi:MAG: MarR family transcriptional regulator [Propionibacteriaceae bacterium]
MQTSELDLPTMVSLAGPAVIQLLLSRMAAAGHQGVKPSHGYVIQRLVNEQPTVGELAQSLGMTQQGASKQVADLERLGYVERVPDPRDQRIRIVRLTRAGRRLLESGREARAELEREVTERVGAANTAAAKVALTALIELTEIEGHIASRSVPLPSST